MKLCLKWLKLFKKKGNFRHKKTVILLYFQTKCICSIYLSISIVCIFSLSPKFIPKEEENTSDNNNNKNYKNIATKNTEKNINSNSNKNVILPPVIYEVTVIMLNTIHKLTLWQNSLRQKFVIKLFLIIDN